MDSLELDINKYDLDDLLKLFQLSSDFTSQELKESKSIVYKVHPDKSGLDKRYFLFFSKAYKTIYNLYELRRGNDSQITDEDKYIDIIKCANSQEFDSNLKQLNKHKEFSEIKKNPISFNNWFNKLFEQTVVDEDESEAGHGSWLASKDIDIEVAKTPSEMMTLIENKKRIIREKQLTIYNNYEAIQSNTGERLIKTNGITNNTTDIFSKLQYDDVRDVYENGVIPITNDDFINRAKFKNEYELNNSRTIDDVQSNKYIINHTEIMNTMEESDRHTNMSRMYDLIKQDELNRKQSDKMWGSINRLEN